MFLWPRPVAASRNPKFCEASVRRSRSISSALSLFLSLSRLSFPSRISLCVCLAAVTVHAASRVRTSGSSCRGREILRNSERIFHEKSTGIVDQSGRFEELGRTACLQTGRCLPLCRFVSSLTLRSHPMVSTYCADFLVVVHLCLLQIKISVSNPLISTVCLSVYSTRPQPICLSARPTPLVSRERTRGDIPLSLGG